MGNDIMLGQMHHQNASRSASAPSSSAVYNPAAMTFPVRQRLPRTSGSVRDVRHLRTRHSEPPVSMYEARVAHKARSKRRDASRRMHRHNTRSPQSLEAAMKFMETHRCRRPNGLPTLSPEL